MSRKPRPLEDLERMREASGWYLGAWRDKRGLTLEDLAGDLETSKSQLSDLEHGAINKKGIPTRYNRDWLEKAMAALDVAAGDLIDTNPFVEEPKFAAVKRAFPGLTTEDVERVVVIASGLQGRTGTDG